MSKFVDLTGKRFGRLMAIKQVDSDKWGHPRWLCKCDCGKEKIILSYNLQSNCIKSCGCLLREGPHTIHSHTKNKKFSRTYCSWNNMKERCTNPNNKRWKDYGGRGITVCKRWRNSFSDFLEDMGECPKGLTLERIDNDKGYYKFNCRWATRKEQGSNKRNNLYITCFGKRQLLIEWAEETGIPYKTLWSRIYKYDWLPGKALTTPVRKKKS